MKIDVILILAAAGATLASAIWVAILARRDGTMSRRKLITLAGLLLATVASSSLSIKGAIDADRAQRTSEDTLRAATEARTEAQIANRKAERLYHLQVASLMALRDTNAEVKQAATAVTTNLRATYRALGKTDEVLSLASKNVDQASDIERAAHRSLYPFRDFGFSYAFTVNLSSPAIRGFAKRLRRKATELRDSQHARLRYLLEDADGVVFDSDFQNGFKRPSVAVGENASFFDDPEARAAILNPLLALLIFKTPVSFAQLEGQAPRVRPDFIASLRAPVQQGIYNVQPEIFPEHDSDAFALIYYPDTDECVALFYDGVRLHPDPTSDVTTVAPESLIGIPDLAGTQLVLRLENGFGVYNHDAISLRSLSFDIGTHELKLDADQLPEVASDDHSRLYELRFPNQERALMSMFVERRPF